MVNYVAKFNASVAVVAMTNAETTNPNFPVNKEYFKLLNPQITFINYCTNSGSRNMIGPICRSHIFCRASFGVISSRNFPVVIYVDVSALNALCFSQH